MIKKAARGLLDMATEREKLLIWVLGLFVVTAIGSVGGWIYTVAVTNTKVEANTEAVKEIKIIKRTMADINIGVARLVANSEIRNELMRQEKKRSDYVYGEQKRRRAIIDMVIPHVTNNKIHNNGP